MSLTLRDYQLACGAAIAKEFETHASTLIVVPTGGGKTIIFASVIQQMRPKRAIVLAHREELIFQAKEKIEMVTTLNCEIEMADLVASASLFHQADVVISTVQTQMSGPKEKRRMTRFKPDEFGLLIIDEAHHSAAQSYRKIVDYYRQNTNLKVLGVTATPDRADELALGEIFETVAFDYEIIDAIHNGYLVPIDQQFVKVHDLDFSAVRTTAGDLNGGDLATLMEQEKNMQEVAAASLQIIGNKRTLIFTASVKQAETLASIMNRHRNGMADWVCGKTPKQQRRDLLKAFSDGTKQVMINCGVLTEGYDNPAVEIVVMARPTKSRSLYSQMCGRGTRSLPGVIDGIETADERKAAIASSAKPSLLVVDFVGNSGRHKLMTSADILGGKVSEEAIEIAKEKAKKNGAQVRMSDLLDESEDEIRKEREQRRLQEEARKARVVAQAKFTSTSIDPFERYGVRFEKQNHWDSQNGRSLTEKQRAIVRKLGVDPDSVSVSCGRKLIASYFARPASEKQVGILKKFGLKWEGVSCTEASKALNELAANGWKKPNFEPPPEVYAPAPQPVYASENTRKIGRRCYD